MSVEAARWNKEPDAPAQASDAGITPEAFNSQPDEWRFHHKALARSVAAKHGYSLVEDYTMMSPARAKQFYSKTDTTPVDTQPHVNSRAKMASKIHDLFA